MIISYNKIRRTSAVHLPCWCYAKQYACSEESPRGNYNLTYDCMQWHVGFAMGFFSSFYYVGDGDAVNLRQKEAYETL